MGDKSWREPPKKSAKAAPTSAPSLPKPHAEIEKHIGRQLKALYDEVLSQPIPDRLLELLGRLDAKTGDK